MKFHIISDMHTEERPFFLKNIKHADCLILAGDIGHPETKVYCDLIQKASAMYSYVFVVKGNHECYGHTVQKTDELISCVTKDFDNVFYLNRSTVDICDDIRVLGTTLWSDVQEYQRSEIGIFISDYRLIKDWCIDNHNHAHHKDVAFIKKEMERALLDNKRLLIVTHHAPMVGATSKPQHARSVLSSAFCTDLKRLFTKPVAAWVFGHTHHSCSLRVNDIPLVSNQRGYGDECDTGFDPDFVIDV